MVVGHTHFSCDRLFGHLSNYLSKCKLLHTENIIYNCNNISSVNYAIEIDKIFDFKNYIEKFYDEEINLITDKCDFYITKSFPTKLYCSKNFVNHVKPSIYNYETCCNIIKDVEVNIHDINFVEKSTLSKNKVEALKSLYKKGLVEDSYPDYYCCNHSEFSTQ